MDNRISVRDGRVVFRKEDIDIPALVTCLRRHDRCTGTMQHGDIEESEACFAARQLLIPGGNLYSREGRLVVELGMGRPGRSTWKRLRATIAFLNRFVLRTKSHVVTVRDEEAEDDTFHRESVVFSPGERRHAFISDLKRALSEVEAQIDKLEKEDQ